VITSLDKVLSSLEQHPVPMKKIITILGPTASGKTALAVQLARHIGAEIISADSRQVYRHMDIGTGKDLSEYQDIPYHLIDICEPGEKYHLAQFIHDFQHAHQQILTRNKYTILCGGTGLYLQSVLQHNRYAQIPVIEGFKEQLIQQSRDDLLHILSHYSIPSDFSIDTSTNKRIVRAIEILEFLKYNPADSAPQPQTQSIVFGLNPPVEARRQQISNRLRHRLEQGFLEEVSHLLAQGLRHLDLQYYGLEYKYASLYLLGEIDESYFMHKLETEIHRYAKRQMTYFRKMEKDGVQIHWI